MATSGNPAKAAAAKHSKKPVTFDHLRGKKPIERKVYVHLDPALSEAFDDVDGRLDELRRDHRERRLRAANTAAGLTDVFERMLEDEIGVVEREWAEADAALQDSTVVVLMRSPGRKRYEALVNEHPPTEEQNAESQREHKQDAPYNAETFGPALVAACAVEPELTEEQAQSLIDDWNLNEAMLLVIGALEVCQATQVSHLGKGSGRTSVSTRN